MPALAIVRFIRTGRGNEKTMRIVSYNILNGGEGRADQLAEVIEAQRPDVVALVEAVDVAVLQRIATRLGMDWIHAPGNAQASALLSRFPIRRTVNHAPLCPGLSRSLLEAAVDDPRGRQWTFGVVHLHPHAGREDEARREQELAIVLDRFAPHRRQNIPHILLGDFNANAPSQRIDPARCKPSTREEWQANGGQIPRRVIQRLIDGGYVDAIHACLGNEAETTGTFSTQFPGLRIDYIFTHGIDPARFSAAWIERDRLAKYASDHFPVGLELCLPENARA
jgi:endonuclease/exonuclease/phosphatase family metal-dependent hydrolase